MHLGTSSQDQHSLQGIKLECRQVCISSAYTVIRGQMCTTTATNAHAIFLQTSNTAHNNYLFSSDNTTNTSFLFGPTV